MTDAATEDFNFKLAVYPNRMRSDAGVYVQADLPIEPYPGVIDPPCYPSNLRGGYSIPVQLPHAFAFELVRRWNAVNGESA